ncbi:DNA polymerase domain-containing protein, partial [Streptomyces caeruleatus]
MKQHFDDEVKRKEYDTLQQLCKLDINSIYGASANTFFTFFKADIARAITAMGQYSIKAISANLNGIMNVLCDTKDFTYF